MIEVWKPINEFNGLYEASNLGRLRKGQQIKKQTLCNNDKYYFVTVSFNNKTYKLSTHRLIAWAFIGSQTKGIEVRHLNGDSHDNRADNLCYGSKADNMRDAIKHRTFSMSEWHPCCKLTNDQIKYIKESKLFYKDIAKELGIHPHTVHKIRRKEVRNHD